LKLDVIKKKKLLLEFVAGSSSLLSCADQGQTKYMWFTLPWYLRNICACTQKTFSGVTIFGM